MRKILLCFLFVLLCVNGSFSACVMQSTVEDEYNSADHVFIGEVVRIEKAVGDKAKVVFKVLKLYKGGNTAELAILQPLCMYPQVTGSRYECWIEEIPRFQIGEQNLIFGSGSVEDLHVMGCHAGAPLVSKNAEALQKLDEIVSRSGN